MKTKITEVKVYEVKTNPLVDEAKTMNITSDAHLDFAADTLSKMNKILDGVTAEKEKVTKPLNEALKAERLRWKPIESMIEEGISVLRSKMSAYHTLQTKLALEEEAKIAARVGAGKGKIKIDTAMKKMESVVQAPKKAVAESGKVTFRQDQKLKITDEAKIPREYLVIDEAKLLRALKLGISVSGAEIEIISTPINTRN